MASSLQKIFTEGKIIKKSFKIESRKKKHLFVQAHFKLFVNNFNFLRKVLYSKKY